jgi:putative tricarboxylic transport membrane protein
MKVSDIVCGAALLLLAIVVGVYARTFPTIPGQLYGAGAFPTVIAVGLGAFSLVLIARALGEARAAGRRGPAVEFAEWARTPRTLVNFAATILLVLAYVLFSEQVGFIPISSAILILLFWRTRVRPLTAVIVGVAMSIVIHVAFVDFLRVPLPRGILDRVLW